MEQLLRPRITVRLERNHEPAAERGTGSRQDRGDFGWMVAVVVDHHHSVGFAVTLEPSLGSVEPAQRGSDPIEIESDELAGRHRRERVLQVVPTRYDELEHPQPLHATAG